MLNFFRSIRKYLLSENKLSKYLIYAIGEIFLVMIGILLALQVNNWNQNRIDKKSEKLLLSQLHAEFRFNKSQLDTVVFYHNRAYKSINYLASQLPITLDDVNLDSLAYHLNIQAWTYTYNPSLGVISALISSSSFDLISNDELRDYLVRWNDLVSDYRDEEINAHKNYMEQIKPFEKKHFYWSADYKKYLSDPRLDLSILESVEFDNMILDRLNDLMNIMDNPSGELEAVQNAIDRIIELSQSEN